MLRKTLLLAATALALTITPALAQTAQRTGFAVTVSAASQVHYRTAMVDGTEIFYREAGPANAPTILLLHGFPTSSQMFRNLIPLLADRYHVVAPDYPGFGHSAAPDRARFAYSFDLHMLDTGHFALETHGVEIAGLIRDFMARKVTKG